MLSNLLKMNSAKKNGYFWVENCLSGKMEITMSPNRPCFSPADSDDLFDSLTGELIYSLKNLFSLIPMRKQIEFKNFKKLSLL